ncbi:DUF1993 domain-containing protein [Phenylobacterium hankyongense]|uniref:DUF1993 domain-containing protein n=1 Tax=Phenylobacterium hankyongense TaxID=1813876 RepID=A0A328B6G8_9CAUL|nr:DUF1993 domain-containing protein [Phenylobacterium hankyongense]RAK61526.1 DUF1993 domain-containing protein [Phenylobacterium hankyongense]
MKADLYSFVGIYSRNLDTLANILTKGAEFAAANGVSEAEMLDWRLADDMFPLRRQAQIVRDFAVQWPARAAGLPVPAALEGEPDLAQLRAAISEAKAALANLKPDQFEGRDEVPLTVNIGPMEPTLPAAQWILGFATTNFYFHLSMAYAILRAKGVPIGKIDLFAGGL